MAWNLLPVDYTDAEWAGLKKYLQVDNPDGTISLQDVTVYSQKEKSFFGALDANRMNEALNTIMSMLENGTDLYGAFQNYFAEQKTLFTNKANSEFLDFERYAQDLKDQGDSIISTLETSTEADYEAYQEFLAQLQADGDAALTEIETGYERRMSTFESVSKESFDEWFANLQDQLSGDVAARLTLLTAELDDRLSRLEYMVIQNDITAPVCDDDDALLTDDLGYAIVADWKHREV